MAAPAPGEERRAQWPRETGRVAGAAALGAVLVGGVAQTYLWRWGLGGLGDVLGSQFTGLLLIFAVSWAWARGRLAAGAVCGAVTGCC
ncbi:MAG: hypothetical protein R2731_17755 [Nocardioides sp.]